MNHLNQFLAAMSLALVPGVALAQTAMPDPAIPGSGYQIPEAHPATQPQLHSADDADLSQPGDGYRIPEVKSPYAPSAPVMNENGTYPSHSRHA